MAQRDRVLFRYTPKHYGIVPVELLSGFHGYAIAEASSVYHELHRTQPDITEVASWAHARRRWFDALAIDRERARVGIGFIGCSSRSHRSGHEPDRH